MIFGGGCVFSGGVVEMKVSDLTVIMLQSDRKNIENDNICVVSKLGQNQGIFFPMYAFPIYKWFPFIK